MVRTGLKQSMFWNQSLQDLLIDWMCVMRKRKIKNPSEVLLLATHGNYSVQNNGNKEGDGDEVGVEM